MNTKQKIISALFLYLITAGMCFAMSIDSAIESNADYKLEFVNATLDEDLSLKLTHVSGVNELRGLSFDLPVNLSPGDKRRVSFVVQGAVKSWSLKFKICQGNKLNSSEEPRCDLSQEYICLFEANGYGALPVYTSKSEDQRYACSPSLSASQQYINFKVR